METKKPAHEAKQGRVLVTIWENQGRNGTFYSLTVGRLYKTGNDWKTSASLSRKDIPLARTALEEAAAWLASKPEEEQVGEEP